MNINELIDSLGDLYDIEALQDDYNSGNVDLDDPQVERYYKPQIVADSVINGQFKQARAQYDRYSLTAACLFECLDPMDAIKAGLI